MRRWAAHEQAKPKALLFLADVRIERRQINKGADWHCLAWR